MSTISNFVQVTLRTAISDTDDTIRFQDPAAPANAPPDPAGQTAYAVLIDSLSAPTKFEIVTYTRMTFNRLRNVQRGQDGTTAQSWTEGTVIAQDLPAALAEPLGLVGQDGEALKVGANGKLTTARVDWSEIAGVPIDTPVSVFDRNDGPVTPPLGEATVFYGLDSGGIIGLHILFPDGTSKVIAAEGTSSGALNFLYSDGNDFGSVNGSTTGSFDLNDGSQNVDLGGLV